MHDRSEQIKKREKKSLTKRRLARVGEWMVSFMTSGLFVFPKLRRKEQNLTGVTLWTGTAC